MLSIKPGVTLLGLVPQMSIAVIVLHELYKEAGAELRITSGNDGEHMRSSEHKAGKALDFGIRGSAVADYKGIALSAGIALGPHYQVLLEVDHIHVEWDPQ
jgi:hypothetical protein